MNRVPLSLILPLAAILFIVICGGGLGVSFIFLAKTSLEQWGAVIVGVIVIVGVPAIAALLTMPRR